MKILLANQSCGSGIRCLFDPWIRDPAWAKNQDPGSGMNIPDHIFGFRALKKIFWVKKSDPGSGMEKIQIRDKHPGSATL
jgi:hypothetical protein